MKIAHRLDLWRWFLARRIARRLPACVVAQCVSRMVGETYREGHDPLSPLAMPVSTFTGRWADRYPSCR